MINELKNSVKLSRYSEGFISVICIGVIFFLLGIFNLTYHCDNAFLPAFQMILGMNYITQQGQSLIFCGFIGASPKRKSLEYHFPRIMNVISAIIVYIIILLICIHQYNQKSMNIKELTELYFSGVIGIITTIIIMALMLQHMVISFIMLFVIMITCMISAVYSLSIFVSPTFGILLIKGFVLLFIGIVLMLLIRKLILNHPYHAIYEKYGASTKM